MSSGNSWPAIPKQMQIDAGRAIAVRTGVRLEVFSIVWMLVEAVLSIGAGFLARSVLLIAFGIDSGIELITGGIVLWRLSVESHDGDLEHVESAERRAAWVTGIALALLCVYVFATAAFNLITRGQPKSSLVGIAVALAALVVMPWLAVSKRRISAHQKRIVASRRREFHDLCVHGGDGSHWAGTEHNLPFVVGRRRGRPRLPVVVDRRGTGGVGGSSWRKVRGVL